jgi:aldehyde dehydrogenase (NAD+)
MAYQKADYQGAGWNVTYSQILKDAGLGNGRVAEGNFNVRSPIDGSEIAKLKNHSPSEVLAAITTAAAAFRIWREVPAPRRGELVRLFGEELRKEKENLGRLVTLESGKILQEGYGEVQEMIDICDLAVGQSRQLFGLTIASERPGHSMREAWHPLGVCGVITAFNFPVAPWAWNARSAAARSIVVPRDAPDLATAYHAPGFADSRDSIRRRAQ